MNHFGRIAQLRTVLVLDVITQRSGGVGLRSVPGNIGGDPLMEVIRAICWYDMGFVMGVRRGPYRTSTSRAHGASPVILPYCTDKWNRILINLLHHLLVKDARTLQRHSGQVGLVVIND